MMTIFLISFLFSFSYSENDCEMIYGSSFNTTLYRSSITNYCFTVIDSLFVRCMSDTSGGAISIHCRPSYGIVHDCTFVYCQTKVQGACVYFIGNSFESFRCCVFNCSATYNAMFSSTQLTAQGEKGKETTIDMLTIVSSSAQTNAILAQNGNSHITNFNLTKSRSTGIILAIEFTDISYGEISFFTFDHNRGDTRDNSIVYILGGENHQIHHGNVIGNKCLNGGYIFNFISPVTVSDCIFDENERAILMAIRYYVTFVECVFDGAETKTEFMTIKSCHFLTETATMKFTMMECTDFPIDKLNAYSADHKTIEKSNVVIFLLVVSAVSIVVAVIFSVILKVKRGDDDHCNDALSVKPLIH